jgi:NADPH-dependent 2,4-dienoyl-CoA reductase/sulfur reductase-like enzyme
MRKGPREARRRLTLLDRHNYHQFQPLLYQVATSELSTADVARPLRAIFKRDKTVRLHKTEVTHVDPTTRTVTTADGRGFSGDYLVLAAGSQPNFFHTPGASEHAFPLYTTATTIGQRGSPRTGCATSLGDPSPMTAPWHQSCASSLRRLLPPPGCTHVAADPEGRVRRVAAEPRHYVKSASPPHAASSP